MDIGGAEARASERASDLPRQEGERRQRFRSFAPANRGVAERPPAQQPSPAMPATSGGPQLNLC
eukprot:15196805-Alexandrium_andersonii.AAC.1